jgi:hypothetical protein
MKQRLLNLRFNIEKHIIGFLASYFFRKEMKDSNTFKNLFFLLKASKEQPHNYHLSDWLRLMEFHLLHKQ